MSADAPAPASEYSNFLDVIEQQAQRLAHKPAFRMLGSDGSITDEISYAELDIKSRKLAATLSQVAQKGDRVIIALDQNIEAVITFCACIQAGMIAAIVAPPAGAKSWPRFERILENAKPAVICTASRRQKFLDENRPNNSSTLNYKVIAVDEPTAYADEQFSLAVNTIDKADTAFLQYSSGTTGAPKGVMISHENILDNVEIIRLGYHHTEDCIGLSWAPLYHDLGLVGSVLQSLYCGMTLILMSPLSFVRDPALWLRSISRYGVSSSPAPNFAFDHCLNRIKPEQLDGVDLSCWTRAITGAEIVRPETINKFADAFAPYGFSFSAYFPCYGMAESTLYITAKPYGETTRILTLSRQALSQGQFKSAADNEDSIAVASCGQPISHVVKIVDPNTHSECADHQVGEIWLKSRSISKGYWQQADLSEQTFNNTISDSGASGFFRTGDLGALYDGELYLTGRLKEIVIIRGKNYYPVDIERAVQTAHEGFRLNSGASFSVEKDGSEKLVVVQEVLRSHSQSHTQEELAGLVKLSLSSELSVDAHDIVFVKQATLPMTTSGKIQRTLIRDQYLNGNLKLADLPSEISQSA